MNKIYIKLIINHSNKSINRFRLNDNGYIQG